MRSYLKKGIIRERFITYEEYVDELYLKRKKNAVELLSKLPKINDTVADSVVSSLYEEIKSSYAFGIFTSTIINSILLLEYSMRVKIYKKEIQNNSGINWAELEDLSMRRLINRLKELMIIDEKEHLELMDFKDKIRNPYMHFKIHKLIQGIEIRKLPKLNLLTGEIAEEKNVIATKYRSMWFSAKQFFDKEKVQDVIDVCIYWTNKLLGESKDNSSDIINT